MKNHLSMLGSIGAAGNVSLGATGGSWSGLTKLGDFLTVRLVLDNVSSFLLAKNLLINLR